MKLHLPSGLRKALLACLAALSAALPPTLGSASGIAAAFAALSVLAPQQVAADFPVHNNDDWASLFGNVANVGDNSGENVEGGKVIISQTSEGSIYFRQSSDTVLADLQFDTDLSLNNGYSNNSLTYTFSGAFTGSGSFKLTGNIHHQHYIFTGDLSGWGGHFEITGGAGGDIIEFSGEHFVSSHGSIILTANDPGDVNHNPGPSRLIVDGVTLDNSSIQAGELQLKQAVTFSGGFENAGQTVTITGETTFDTGSSLKLGTGADVTLATVADASKTLTSLTMEDDTSFSVTGGEAGTEMTATTLTLNGAAEMSLGDHVTFTAGTVGGSGSLSSLTLGEGAVLSLGGGGPLKLTGAFTYGTGAKLKLTGQITIDLSDGGSLSATAGDQKLTIDLTSDLLGQLTNGAYHLFEGLGEDQSDLFTFTVDGTDPTKENLRLDEEGYVVWGAEYTWNGGDQAVTLSGDTLTTANHWDKEGTLDADSAVTLNGQNGTEVTVTVGDGATMRTLTLTGSPTNYKFAGDGKTLTVSGKLIVEKSASFEGSLAVTAGDVVVGAEGASGRMKFSGGGNVTLGSLTLQGTGTVVEVGSTNENSGGLLQFSDVTLGAGTSLVLTGTQFGGASATHGWKTATGLTGRPTTVHGEGSVVLKGLGDASNGSGGAGILWAFTGNSEDDDNSDAHEIGNLKLTSDDAGTATFLKFTAEMGNGTQHGLANFLNVWVENGNSLEDGSTALGKIKHTDVSRTLRLAGAGDNNTHDGALILSGNTGGKVFWGIMADSADATVSVKGSNRTLFGTVNTNGHTLSLKTDAADRTVKLVGNLAGTGTLALTGDGTVELGTEDDGGATSTFSASGSATIDVQKGKLVLNYNATGKSNTAGKALENYTVKLTDGATLEAGTDSASFTGKIGTLSGTGNLTVKANGRLTLGKANASTLTNLTLGGEANAGHLTVENGSFTVKDGWTWGQGSTLTLNASGQQITLDGIGAAGLGSSTTGKLKIQLSTDFMRDGVSGELVLFAAGFSEDLLQFFDVTVFGDDNGDYGNLKLTNDGKLTWGATDLWWGGGSPSPANAVTLGNGGDKWSDDQATAGDLTWTSDQRVHLVATGGVTVTVEEGADMESLSIGNGGNYTFTKGASGEVHVNQGMSNGGALIVEKDVTVTVGGNYTGAGTVELKNGGSMSVGGGTFGGKLTIDGGGRFTYNPAGEGSSLTLEGGVAFADSEDHAAVLVANGDADLGDVDVSAGDGHILLANDTEVTLSKIVGDENELVLGADGAGAANTSSSGITVHITEESGNSGGTDLLLTVNNGIHVQLDNNLFVGGLGGWGATFDSDAARGVNLTIDLGSNDGLNGEVTVQNLTIGKGVTLVKKGNGTQTVEAEKPTDTLYVDGTVDVQDGTLAFKGSVTAGGEGREGSIGDLKVSDNGILSFTATGSSADGNRSVLDLSGGITINGSNGHVSIHGYADSVVSGELGGTGGGTLTVGTYDDTVEGEDEAAKHHTLTFSGGGTTEAKLELDGTGAKVALGADLTIGGLTGSTLPTEGRLREINKSELFEGEGDVTLTLNVTGTESIRALTVGEGVTIRKEGTGTQNLTDATVDGNLYVEAGTLQLKGIETEVNGKTQVNTSGTLDIDTDEVTLSDLADGDNGGGQVTGSGTLHLTDGEGSFGGTVSSKMKYESDGAFTLEKFTGAQLDVVHGVLTLNHLTGSGTVSVGNTGGTLQMGSVLSNSDFTGKMKLTGGGTLGLYEGSNALNSLEVSGDAANTLNFADAGGTLDVGTVSGTGTLDVGAKADSSLNLNEGNANGLVVNLGDGGHVTLKGGSSGVTLKSVGGNGKIDGKVTLTGDAEADTAEHPFSGSILASADVTLSADGHWTLGDTTVEGSLKVDGTLHVNGDVVLNKEMSLGAAGTFAEDSTGTLHVGLSKDAASAAQGAIHVDTGNTGLTWGPNIVLDNPGLDDIDEWNYDTWSYQLFGSLAHLSDKFDAFAALVEGKLDATNLGNDKLHYHLNNDGTLSIQRDASTLTWINDRDGDTWETQTGKSAIPQSDGWENDAHFLKHNNAIFGKEGIEGGTVKLQGTILAGNVDIAVGNWEWTSDAGDDQLTIEGALTVKAGTSLTVQGDGTSLGIITLKDLTVESGSSLTVKISDGGDGGLNITRSGAVDVQGVLEVELSGTATTMGFGKVGSVFLSGGTTSSVSEMRLTNADTTKRTVNFGADLSTQLVNVTTLTIGSDIEVSYAQTAASPTLTLSDDSAHTVKLDGGSILFANDAQIDWALDVTTEGGSLALGNGKTGTLNGTLKVVEGATLELTTATGSGTVALADKFAVAAEDSTGTTTVGANTTLKNAQTTGGSLDMGSLTVSMNGGTLDVGANGMTLSNLEGDTGTINSSATGALTLKDGEGSFGGTVSSALNYNAADGSYTVATFSGSGALDVHAGALTVTTLTASNNNVTVGNGTTLTVTGWTGKLGTLTLNGRLELGTGKLDVTQLKLGGVDTSTLRIEMGEGTTLKTTFANGLLESSNVNGKAKLEVSFEQIQKLQDHKYHLFDQGSLTDAASKFETYYALTIVENSDEYSSNDCNRWEWTLDNDGWLTFTEKDDPSQWLTWTATGSDEGNVTLQWKVGGTTAESGWDDQEIFRDGDKVKFTADDTEANTVTLQEAITTGGVTVEKGVFNFRAKSGSETLTVTGDMTVSTGAEANIECSATVDTLKGVGTLKSSEQTGNVTVTNGLSDFTGTLGVTGGGQLKLGTLLAGSATLSLDNGTITLKEGANTFGTGKVRVEAGGGTLKFATGSTNSLTATLESAEGAGKLTLEGGSYTLSGETKGEVSLAAGTTLTGGDAGVEAAGVSSAATDATLGGKVTLTGDADGAGSYTYAGKLNSGLELTVTGGAHNDTLANQTITSLNITGGSLTWNGNLTMGKLDGTVDLGKAGNTLTLNGVGGGTYTGALTLDTLDVKAGVHTVADGTIGTLKVATGSTLTSAGGDTPLTVTNVLNGDANGGTVELTDGATLSLANGANKLGTLKVSGTTADTLTLAGGSLETALSGDGTLNVTTTGAEASLTLDRGTSGQGVTVNLGDKTKLTGNGTTLKSVTGTGTITATDLSLTGATPAPATGFSGVIDANATVTLNDGGSWKLSDGARINGTLTTNGTLTLDGTVTLNHQMIVGATGGFAGSGTLDIQLANEDAETAGGAIKWESTVTPGQVGGIRITFSGDAAVNDDTRWEYQLFNDLNGASFGASDWDAFRKAVLGVLGRPSEAHKDWSFELSQDGVLSINPATDTQQWLEGDAAFTWKDADGELYNKWTVGGAPEQVFSSEQNVEFAGTSTDPITVTVEGGINIAGHDMEVRQGEGVQGPQSYTFELKNAVDKLTVRELSVGQGVTTDFNVGSGSVTASTTVVNGTLVLSGSGTRNFGDVTVNDGASVWVKQGENVSGKVHGDGTLYFDWTDATGQQTETAFRSLVSVEEGHTLEKAEIVTGTSLELSEAESAAPLGRVKNLTVETGANLTVSSADAIAGANPSVHLAGAGVNNSGALAVTAQGTVSMDWGITLDANASVSVGSGSTLQYGGKLDFGMAAEGQENNRLTKTGTGTLELSGNYAQGGAAGNFDVQQGTLKFSYTKSPDIEADGTVALAAGATLESTITGTLGTLSGSGALKVSGGELTVKDLSGATLRNVEFSNGGKLHVGTNTLTGGGTLTVGAGGGTLDIVLTGDGVTDGIVNGGNILNFSALEQTGGGKVTLHLTGYEQFYNSSSIESDEQFTASLPPSYQLFEAENFKKLWEALNVGSDEGWWKPYFDIEVEITNRLIPELSTDGLLTFTKDVGFVWKGGGDNTWSAGNAGHTGDTHWVDGKAPEPDDNVTFDGEGQGDVLLDGDVKAKDVWVEKGGYTFTGKKDDVKDSLTVTDGDLVVQKDASLNLNVELKGVRKDTLVVLQGDDKARGTLNVQEDGVLGENTHVKFEGGQLKYDSSSTAEDLSGKVLADESTSGVRVLVEGADAKGTTWGNTVSGPADGVQLALEKGIEKSGDGQFTLRWKDSVTPEPVYQGPITVTDGKLTLDVTAEFPHSKSKLSGDVRLDGELDVLARTQTQLATPETTVELSGAVSGKGTLKATSGQVGLTGDLSKFSGSLAADGAGTCLVLSGNAVAGGTVGAAVSGNGGTVAVDGGDADVTLTGKVSGKDLTLRNDGSGELFVTLREPGNGSGTKLDGGKGGITLGSATSAVTWVGSQVTGGDITLSNVTLGQGGFTGGKGSGRIFVDTAPVPTSEIAPVAAANPQGGIVDVNGMNIGTFDGIAVNGYGTLRGLNGGSYTVGAEKALSLFFTPQNAENNTWSETAAEPKGQALVQGSGFTVELAAGNATANGLQLAFDYSVIRWFREHNSLYVRALDGGTWTHEGTVLDWMKMTDNVAQLMQVIVGTNYTFTDDGLQMNGSAKDLYVVMDDAENSDPEHSVTPEDLREKRATVVLDGKTLTLDWNGATVKDAPDGRIPNLLGGDEGTRLVIRNTADSSKTTTNRLEVEVDNTLREVRDGRFEDENGVPHLPEADGTHVQGEDTTFLGSITGELGVDLTKSGKGTLTVGGNYSMAEGTTKLKEGALVLRGGTNELRDLEFAYTTAQDTENNEKRRGLEVTDGGKTTVSGVIKESNEGGFSGDISVTQGAELVLQGESTLQSTGITGDNSGTLTLDGEASLTLAGDGKPDDPQLSGITVQVGANATLDTGRDQSELTALNGNGTLESNEGGKVTVHGGSFSGTLAPSPTADGGNPDAGTLKVADGASFTFDNAKSAAGSSEDPGAWDVELGKGVNLTVKVDKKSGSDSDRFTLGHITLGGNNLTVDFGAKAIGENYFAATLADIKSGSLTFNSDGMVKGNTHVDTGVSLAEGDQAAWNAFKDRVHFTGAGNFLTEQNVHTEGGKVIIDYSEATDNKLLGERGIPGAGKNGRAGAGMVWDSLKDKSQSQAFFDALMNPGSDFYRMGNDLIQMYDSGDTAGMERVLTSVAGASIATLGPALAQDIHRQLKSIRNRSTSMSVEKDADEFNSTLIRHAWINGESGYYKLEEDGYLPGFTLNSWGGTVGVDMNVSSNTVFALAVSAMYGDLKPHAAETADGSLDTTWLSGVVHTTRGPWIHTFVLSGGLADAEINRTVNYGSGSYRTSGSTDGYAVGVLYEVGYTHLLNKEGRSALQPIANIEWRHVSLDGYTEDGSDAGLSVNKISQDIVTLGAGARLQTIVGANWVNHAALLETRALVKADIGDRSGTAENALVGMGNKGRGEVETAEVGSVGIEVGAGVSVPLGPRSGSIFADASVEWRSGWTAFDATVGYKISF